MMIRTQRIRKISPATRRPRAGRPVADPMRRVRRGEAPAPIARRAGALTRPRPQLPGPPARKRRSRRLRLVVVNARPRKRRAPAPKPVLRLLRGRAPALALPRRAAPPRTLQRSQPRSRAAQLVFVLAMAAVGLVALATSVGQILARGM